MKQLFQDLEKATYSRLLYINKDIKKARDMNTSLTEIKEKRRSTDQLLSSVRQAINKQNFSHELYHELKDKFLKSS